jgi:hypothetical protein
MTKEDFKKHSSYQMMAHIGFLDILTLVSYIAMGCMLIWDTDFGNVFSRV